MPAMKAAQAVRAQGAAKLKQGVGGRLASAKSKTSDPTCSQAVSDWRRKGGPGLTAAVAATLGRCRAKARLLRQGALAKAGGNDLRAAHLEHRATVQGGVVGIKARHERAMQLVAERRGKHVVAHEANKPTAAPHVTPPGKDNTATVSHAERLERVKGIYAKVHAAHEKAAGRTGLELRPDDAERYQQVKAEKAGAAVGTKHGAVKAVGSAKAKGPAEVTYERPIGPVTQRTSKAHKIREAKNAEREARDWRPGEGPRHVFERLGAHYHHEERRKGAADLADRSGLSELREGAKKRVAARLEARGKKAESDRLVGVRGARAERKAKGVPEKDWSGAPTGKMVPYSERLASQRAELQSRRAGRVERKAEVAREGRYERLGAALPESKKAVGRDRSQKAGELRAKRSAPSLRDQVVAHRASQSRTGKDVRTRLAKQERTKLQRMRDERATRKAGSPAEFAERVKKAAHAVPQSENFHDKAYVSDIHKHYEKAHGPMPIADFKRKMLEAHQGRHLSMSRADLVQAMPEHKVKGSQIAIANPYGGPTSMPMAEFHLLHLPSNKPQSTAANLKSRKTSRQARP